MMRLIAHFIELAQAAATRGITPEQIATLDVMRPLSRMSEDIGEDRLDAFAVLEARMEQSFAALVPQTEQTHAA
jgi:hypothetical protein